MYLHIAIIDTLYRDNAVCVVYRIPPRLHIILQLLFKRTFDHKLMLLSRLLQAKQ